MTKVGSLVVALIALAVLALAALVSANRNRARFDQARTEANRARTDFDQARTEANQARTDLAVYRQKYLYTKEDLVWAKKDNSKRSHSIISGKVAEHLAPLLPGWPPELNPHDARFMGNPVDFVVFDGLNEGGEVNVFIVEAKTGRSRLNGNQRRIRDAIDAGRVYWQEVWLNTEVRVSEVPDTEMLELSELPALTEDSAGNGQYDQPPDSSDGHVGKSSRLNDALFEADDATFLVADEDEDWPGG